MGLPSHWISSFGVLYREQITSKIGQPHLSVHTSKLHKCEIYIFTIAQRQFSHSWLYFDRYFSIPQIGHQETTALLCFKEKELTWPEKEVSNVGEVFVQSLVDLLWQVVYSKYKLKDIESEIIKSILDS